MNISFLKQNIGRLWGAVILGLGLSGAPVITAASESIDTIAEAMRTVLTTRGTDANSQHLAEIRARFETLYGLTGDILEEFLSDSSDKQFVLFIDEINQALIAPTAEILEQLRSTNNANVAAMAPRLEALLNDCRAFTAMLREFVGSTQALALASRVAGHRHIVPGHIAAKYSDNVKNVTLLRKRLMAKGDGSNYKRRRNQVNAIAQASIMGG